MVWIWKNFCNSKDVSMFKCWRENINGEGEEGDTGERRGGLVGKLMT